MNATREARMARPATVAHGRAETPVTQTVIFAPFEEDRPVALSYAAALRWNVVAVVADPGAAVTRVASRAASTVLTTMEAIWDLGEARHALPEQVKRAGGRLHAGPVREPKGGAA